MSGKGARRAVFLDRDGVLARAPTSAGEPHPPAGVAELELLPGVVDACERLRDAGFMTIVVTNQPDIARGTTTLEEVERINRAVAERAPLDALLVCPHDDTDRCRCRKPEPGLLLDAADRFDLDLRCCVMVGDRWRDVEAGRRAGCLTVFVDRGYSERRPRDPDLVVAELAEAVAWIIASRR